MAKFEKKIATAAIYQKTTGTIRSAPENYWLASIDSWDGAVNHDANAEIMAAAFEMREALRQILWKLNHNGGATAETSKPVTIDRLDITIKNAAALMASLDEKIANPQIVVKA